MNPLVLVVVIFIVLFVAWLVAIPNKNVDNKFIKPPDPIDTGETYDEKIFPLNQNNDAEEN